MGYNYYFSDINEELVAILPECERLTCLNLMIT